MSTEYINLVNKILSNTLPRVPKGLRTKVKTFFLYTFRGYCDVENLKKEGIELIKDILKYKISINLRKNIRYDKFFFEEVNTLSQNKTFPFFMKNIYEIKQKGYGAGELLFSIILKTKNTTKKIGDFTYLNKDIELKALSNGSCASIKAHENCSFRVAKDSFEKIYEEKKTFGNDQFFKDENKFHEYMELLYPNFYDKKVFSNILSQKDNKNKLQYLGYEVLKQYKQIDSFDNLFIVKPNKKFTDLTLVSISNTKEKEFILENIKFSPKLYRGKGTQALGDGYADISIK